MILPRDALTSACREADEAVIAAPYIKADALERLLDLLPADVALTCVTRWTPRDMLFGASDVACRALALDRGGEFRLHPRLHAKYYRCGQRVLVGSANLTAQGMGYARTANLEILCEPAPAFNAVAFERELLDGSRPISDAEFARWETIAQLPPPSSPATKAPEPIDWRPVTRDPEHVWLAYREQWDRIPSGDEQRLARKDLAQLGLPPGLAREQFDAWVNAHLQASSTIDEVRQGIGLAEAEAWESLAVMWGTSKGEASRRRETIQIWTTTFLDGAG